MGLTRKFLSALGIETEKIEQIIEAHTEVTDALKAERDNYRTDAEKKITESENFRKQFEELKSEISAKETAEKKSGAFRKLLKEKGYSEKGIEKIAKYGGYLDGIERDENGGIKNSENLVTSVENEWSEYKPVEKASYAEPSTPPKNSADAGSDIAEFANDYYNRLYGEKKEN